MDSSKNEIAIAIFLGITVGLISFFSFYFLSKKNFLQGLQSKKSNKTTIKISSAPKKTISEVFDLIVDPQESNIISEVDVFTIKGKTLPNTQVIATGDIDDQFLTTNSEDGSFKFEITLKNELTQIFITAIHGNEQRIVEKQLVYEKAQ